MSGRRIGGVLLVLAGTWLASTGCGRDSDSTTEESTASTGGSSSGGSSSAPCVPGQTRECALHAGCYPPIQQTCLANGTWSECDSTVCNPDPYAVYQTCVCSDGCPGRTMCVAGYCDVCQCDCGTCAGARCALEYSTCSEDCLEEHACVQNCTRDLGAVADTGLVEPSDVESCVEECALGSSGLPTPEFEALRACIMRDRHCPSLCYGVPGTTGTAGGAGGVGGASGASPVAGASGTTGAGVAGAGGAAG